MASSGRYCMSNELSLGTNFINNKDCLHFGQLLWPSSGRKVKKLAWVLSIYKHAHNQWCQIKTSLAVTDSGLAVVSCALSPQGDMYGHADTCCRVYFGGFMNQANVNTTFRKKNLHIRGQHL